MNSADNPPARAKFTIAFNWKVTLLCILVWPLLLALGFWQLERAGEKREQQAQLEAQRALPPASLNKLSLSGLKDYRRVIVRGSFDAERSWLLDNKQRNGRVGYEVIAPFYLPQGGIILVNRGWVAAGDSRANRPVSAVVEGELSLFADLVSPSDHPLLDAQSSETGWPKVIMAIEPETMAEQFGAPLADRYLRLDDASPGALVTDWQDASVSVQKHQGYAFQWFAMAFALAVWFVFANSSLGQVVKPRP